jgi:hypothetical protein
MNDAHAASRSGRAIWVRWVATTAIGVLAGFVVIHLAGGISIIVSPVVAAGVTGAAMARLTRPGDRPRSDRRDSPGLSARSRTPSRMLAFGSLLVLVLGACADDGRDSATELPASDPSTERATSDLCTLATEMYQQDSLPTVEQLQRYQQLAPAEIAGPVKQVTEPLIADGDDTISFFKIIATDDNEAAIAEIDAWEEKTCGIPHSGDTALPEGASRELEPDATRVEVDATEYAFHIGDVAPGRTSFELTNAGAETHELLIVKLAQGVTLDEAMQAEGGNGTVEEEWTTNLAAPGGDDEVITLDVEPGNYGLVCFILSADGTLHALLGMQHELTVG